MMDITPFVCALILLVFAFIACFVIPWLRNKTSAAQRQELMAWISIAVRAAEQIFKGQGRGEEKMQYVLNWLEEHGFYVETTQLKAMIEAEVLSLKAQVVA